MPQEYTTYFRSVIVFGRAKVVECEEEVRRSIELLAEKYAPHDSSEHRSAAIERDFSNMYMIRLDIDHMTGKAAIELIQRQKTT